MNFLIFFFTILLQYLPSWVISSITPYGEYGDPPLFITDVMITKNEVECIYFYGNGMITDIFIQVYFEQFNEISSSASDLVLIVSTINNQTYEVIDCVMQGGYNNFIFPNCQYLEKWNSSWYAQSNVLVQDNLYAPFLSGNTWRLCMSNGWASSEEYVRYQSLIVMFGISYSGLANISSSVTLSPTLSPTISPTTSPTPISEFKNMTTITYPYYDLSEIISNCGESFTIKSEITLSGNEKSCLSFFGRGHIHTLHIILNYTLHSPLKDYPHDIYQGLSDFAITLINTQIWQGIQFGGGYFLDETIKEAILSWPEQFNNLYTSSNVIEIDLIIPDLSRYDISSGDDIDSPYQICLHNTYQSDSSLRVNYHSQANLKGITYQCNGHITTLSPTLVPTLSPTIPLPSSIFSYSQSSNSLTLSVSRLTLKSGSRECVELSIGGTLTSLIIRFTFQGNNINWVSDVLLSIEEMGVQCYQIEGLTASYNLHNCTFLSYWPNSLNQVANGFYEGVLDIKQPIILPDYTSRMVIICLSHVFDLSLDLLYKHSRYWLKGNLL